MRVGILTTSFPRYRGDFAGNFVFQLAVELAKREVSVVVVAPTEAGTQSFEVLSGINVRRFGYFWPRRLQRVAYGGGLPANVGNSFLAKLQLPFFFVSFFLHALKSCWSCDLIHAHWIPVGLVGWLVGRVRGIPVILSIHGSDIRTGPRFLTKFVFRRMVAVIASAEETLELAEELTQREVHFIPLPIDTDRFSPKIDATSTAKELGLDEGTAVVTFVGRLDPFKDPLTFVRAAALASRQVPGIVYLLVGDGPLRDEAERLAEELDMSGTIRIIGTRGDINRILRLSTAFVAISPIENVWSMTITEAMFMEVPCIISRAGYSERVFSHGQNSYLVEPASESDLASGICELLSTPQLRVQLVEGALALLREHGKDTESIMTSLMRLYQAVLS